MWTYSAQRFEAISPLLGDGVIRRARTRASLAEIPELLSRGPPTAASVQQQLFGNRNTMAGVVLPDLLTACAAGVALDAPLGSVQRPLITSQAIALHGVEDFEGVLNNLGNRLAPGLTKDGLRIDYGTSDVQTVTFDDRGPVAQAILTYGQSTDPTSPHTVDQLRLFSSKTWPTLPFHAEDVARERVGPVLRLLRR